MREKTINCLFDKIMWTLIYLFPIIAYLLLCCQDSLGLTEFEVFMSANFDCMGSIKDTIYGLFSDEGLLPIFGYHGILDYACYMIWVTIWHVIFDIIVFIPRLFHNLLAKLEKGDL